MPDDRTSVASMQAIRSWHVSSALKSPDCIVAQRSDRSNPPFRPVKPTFQTGLMLLPSVFSLGFVDQPRNPVIFWWTTGNPVNSVQPLPITTLDLAHTKSRLNLGFEALPRNRPWLHLAILATMQPTLDSTSHRLLRTKPTCLFHTWRPHQPWPFVLVLHLHQHQSSRTLPCHT
jgi:hypothetical protein